MHQHLATSRMAERHVLLASSHIAATKYSKIAQF